MSITALTWPTVDEIAAAGGCMGGDDGCSGAYLAIEELKETFALLVDLNVGPSIRTDEPLTLETIGVLTSTLAKIRFDLEYALDSVRTMELQRDAMALEVVPCPKGGDDA